MFRQNKKMGKIVFYKYTRKKFYKYTRKSAL